MLLLVGRTDKQLLNDDAILLVERECDAKFALEFGNLLDKALR